MRSLFRLPVSSVCFFSIVALLLAGAAQADAPSRPPDDPLFWSPPISFSPRCGSLGGCARFDDIALTVGTIGAVRGKSDSGFAALSGWVHAAISFRDLVELGGAFGGHLTHDERGDFQKATMPAIVYGRLRVYPWPWRKLLNSGGLELALAYQRSLVSERLGGAEPPGVDVNRVSLLASRSFGPVDLDAGAAIEVGDTLRRAVMGHGSVALRLFGLARPLAPDEQLRVVLQAAYRWPLPGDPSPSDAYVLGGFEFQTHAGYRFGVSAGPYLFGSRVGGMGLATFSIAWGPRYRNPLAEYIASKPPWIPRFFMDLFHVDPVLGPDGCIRTDPSPVGQRVIRCVGAPDPKDPKWIVLPDGRRYPVGEHVWIRNDGMLVTQRQEELAQLDAEATKEAIAAQLLAQSLSDRSNTEACRKLHLVLDDVNKSNIFAMAEAMPGLRGLAIADWVNRTEACGPVEAKGLGSVLPPIGRLGPGKQRNPEGMTEHKQPAAKPSPSPKSKFLAENEARGGHVLERHVGKTDEQLVIRLWTDKPKSVSTFTDEMTAEAVIKQAIARNSQEVANWLKSSSKKPLALTYSGNEKIGRGIKEAEFDVSAKTNATVVLNKDSNGGYYTLTAYPN